jgi:hypothetical protein
VAEQQQFFFFPSHLETQGWGLRQMEGVFGNVSLRASLSGLLLRALFQPTRSWDCISVLTGALRAGGLENQRLVRKSFLLYGDHTNERLMLKGSHTNEIFR